MQQQPIGLGQPDLANVPTTLQLSYPTLDLDDTEFTDGMSLSPSFHPNPAVGQSPSGDLHSSPVGEWRDTPRTLYKTSPETEVGDNDVLSDLEVEGTEEDEGRSWNDRATRISLFDTTSRQHPDISEEAPFPDCDPSSPAVFQTFARRLHADIRSTSSLLPGITLGPFPRYTAPLHQASSPQHQTSSLQRMRTNTVPQGVPAVADVTGNAPFSQSLSIPRKRSMHLKHPSDPINPYQRPKAGESPPAHHYPAAMIDRTFLRRFRTSSPPQRTVSMKELLVPHAEFRFGYDPEVLASELDCPTIQGSDNIDDGIGSEVTGDLGRDASPAPQTPDVIPTEPPMYETDAWDIPDNADDGTWTPEASSEVHHEPAVKRRRINAGALPNVAGLASSGNSGNSRASHEAPTRTRRPHHDLNKARKRHLQPNLVRTNGCLYGCPLLFSTAYEARRHQEDTHGREEAYSFIKAASGDLEGPIFAKDYRFLLQIAVHALGDKLEPRVRAEMEEALDRDGVVLETSLVNTVARFARDWTKRYECPRCGASFSRLDSKKRHYEKQCR
ncbi:hypothetical protein M407DRAFT_10072 [Tulasnella calospora MUT 4182]|uniref:C2H2-type domain-containing protein n=1 Tax=Tulasnella calospora MUT 4182 TaxID=1051891 RepID=A0A0C3QAV4_9AGAM|nr:hypothetical protein M407DRAFT_10072 [Tulasnella calospora MUT 4182]